MFGTSRRTIFRDLKELEAIGVPYRYNHTNKGYQIDPEFFLPPIDLNLQEALSILFLAEKAMPRFNFPFKNSALMAALKIENNLPVKIKKYCNKALRHVSARAAAQSITHGLDSTFAQLQKAIMKKHRTRLSYKSLYEGKDLELELSPYHLLYSKRAWYVLGHSDFHESIRTFRLSRIKKLETLDKCFLGGDGFDLNEYLGNAWSMIPEGRIYHIKLHFLPRVAENVAEVQWHGTQQVKRNQDGSATIEFRVNGLGEILWWILGYGDQVEVLAPKQLRKKVVETAGNMIKLNSSR